MSDEEARTVMAVARLISVTVIGIFLTTASCTMYVERQRQDSLQKCMDSTERVTDCFYMGGTWDKTLRPSGE